MKTFQEFITEVYDRDVMGSSQIRRQGEGGRVGANRKKSEPEKRRMKAAGGGKMVPAKTYKDRKDIGSQKQRSEKEQQPTRERGSAGLSIRDQQRKAAMERRAKKSGAKTPSASELLKKKTTKAVSPGYKQQKASGYNRTERQKLQRTGDRIIKDIRKGKNKPASDYEK
tara:strand:- start:173 stop:679 length:507 start_codon:yes stop_codon:yes gene_type:complete